MRGFYFILISLSMTDASLAGSCDCSPEIDNASASVTSTCSKTWSNNQCSLDETGATASRIMSNPDAVAAFDQQFSGAFPLALDNAMAVWQTDIPSKNVDQCMAGGNLDPNFLQSAILVTGLRLNDGGETAVRFPELTASAMAFAQEFNLAGKMCADDIEKQNFQQFAGQFGRKCFIFGQSEQYFELNLNLVGSCPFEPDF